MTDTKRHKISAKDILEGGPVVSVLSSRTGFSGSKHFAVVIELNDGSAFYDVEVNGQSSRFNLDEVEKAVACYNEG
ncbi:hypothetical protein G6L37_05440 [Agrobacterium rubi]|nr:hypothetical protein [Agrobacterium rubi]NTF24801.1 hypothetical protein [Agrobacterium rubi]